MMAERHRCEVCGDEGSTDMRQSESGWICDGCNSLEARLADARAALAAETKRADDAEERLKAAHDKLDCEEALYRSRWATEHDLRSALAAERQRAEQAEHERDEALARVAELEAEVRAGARLCADRQERINELEDKLDEARDVLRSVERADCAWRHGACPVCDCRRTHDAECALAAALRT